MLTFSESSFKSFSNQGDCVGSQPGHSHLLSPCGRSLSGRPATLCSCPRVALQQYLRWGETVLLDLLIKDKQSHVLCSLRILLKVRNHPMGWLWRKMPWYDWFFTAPLATNDLGFVSDQRVQVEFVGLIAKKQEYLGDWCANYDLARWGRPGGSLQARQGLVRVRPGWKSSALA